MQELHAEEPVTRGTDKSTYGSFFFDFGVAGGWLLGVSQQGAFSIFPLALHLYVPSFCSTHIVSFRGSPAMPAVAKATVTKIVRSFIV
jgi:hypothetical protein